MFLVSKSNSAMQVSSIEDYYTQAELLDVMIDIFINTNKKCFLLCSHFAKVMLK